MSETDYSEHYTQESFWEKVGSFAKVAGKQVVEKALYLYYAAQDPNTPAWAKAVIYPALGYFILPVDAIPDVVPVVGFADDLGALAAALGAVAMQITPQVKAKAHQTMEDWFGDPAADAS